MWTNLLAAGAALFHVASACTSYGIDFKGDGHYFINKNSNESFTAVSEFYECTGTANVILIAPDGDSFYCSDVPTTPDYTDAVTTCPIQKNQMYSGDWTLVLLDNNGNNTSFSAKRVLHLDVGEQVTSTVIPTITLSVTQTPTSVVNATITDLDSTTLLPSCVTSLASNAKTQTVTSYPPRETITTSSTATVKRTTTVFTYTIKTYTETKVCAAAFAAMSADPTADPSLVAIAQAAVASASSAVVPARRSRIRRDVTKVMQVAKRHGVALAKRAPDSSTVTSTDTDTAHWSSITSSFTAVPVTQTAYNSHDYQTHYYHVEDYKDSYSNVYFSTYSAAKRANDLAVSKSPHMCPASTVREVKSLVILMLASMLCRNPKGRDHTAVVNADVGI
ncbi:hypothetical protein D6D12_00308 [Aureobasidium pullulans]|uniref:Uncharacterized protein n=1 Tax=Aureobasidium pullulans TaxID=5580 RepID=A0AB74K6M9_AURPU|nr:hypothetical protein D6D12_00308 [Aureobasidium pullulans]THX63666.1 hypothetical protein D6D11_01658 [Aureobasidium pullulans]